MRGRKPKPTALKILQGNPGKRPLNEEEPVYPGMQRWPDVLDKGAQREWQRIVALCEPVGTISAADRAALSLYCQAYSRWEHAETELQTHGLLIKSPNGFPMQNPWLPIANKSAEHVRALAVEFGFTPSARSRVKANKKEPSVSGVKRLLG